MDYNEAIAYLNGLNKFGIKLGLEQMYTLCNFLGNPQDSLRFIHVAGTNGKGSVVTYLSYIYIQAGYRVGAYTSPAVLSKREVFQVNQQWIAEEAYAQMGSQMKTAVEQMVSEGYDSPTIFEVETAMAFLYFKHMNCDLVILETGMGGRTDATNVVKHTITSVFTPIAMDHVVEIGPTQEDIARAKAGIIKAGSKIVSVEQNPVVTRFLELEADLYHEKVSYVSKEDIRVSLKTNDTYESNPIESVTKDIVTKENCTIEINSKKIVTEKNDLDGTCQQFTYKTYQDVQIRMLGEHQSENASLAIEVVECNQDLYPVSMKAMYEGLQQAQINGRFSIIRKQPLMIVDGAHNVDAVIKLRRSLQAYQHGRRILAVNGIFRDKDQEHMMQEIIDVLDLVITVPLPNQQRSMPAVELAENWKKVYQDSLGMDLHQAENKVYAADSIKEGVELALSHAEQEDVILIFGSLSLVQELYMLTDIIEVT